MRGFVEDQVMIEELDVSARSHALFLEVGIEQLSQPGEIIKRDAREIVVFEVVIGPEKRHIPKPAGLHQRTPLRRIVRPDVIVLPQPVQCECKGKDE